MPLPHTACPAAQPCTEDNPVGMMPATMPATVASPSSHQCDAIYIYGSSFTDIGRDVFEFDKMTTAAIESLLQIQRMLPERTNSSKNMWLDAACVDITHSEVSLIGGSQYNFGCAASRPRSLNAITPQPAHRPGYGWCVVNSVVKRVAGHSICVNSCDLGEEEKDLYLQAHGCQDAVESDLYK